MTRRLIAIVIALVCAGVSAPAQLHLYVAPGGQDGTNNCQDLLHPCASVAYAFSQSSINGDTLHVAAGTYTEPQLVIDAVSNQNLRVEGAGAALTILQAAAAPGLATDRVLWVKTGANSVFSGVTIRHGNTSAGSTGVGDGGAGVNGGGVLINGSLTLLNCRVEENRTGDGGASDAFSNGGTGGDGGGLYNDGTLVLVDCTIASNRTGGGGAGAVTGGRGGNGSGLMNAGGILSLTNTTVQGNRTGPGGEGATGGHAGNGTLWNSGALSAVNVTISDNACGEGGNALSASGGGGGEGGALWQAVAGSSALLHVTAAGNTGGAGGEGTPAGASGEGGGIFNDGGTVQAGHTILAGNLAGVGASGPDAQGTLTSLGYNLIRLTNGLDLAGDVTGVLTETEPLLGILQDNGGPTATRRLNALSPAVNAGDPAFAAPPATDQRGSPRVQGGVIDLGAYEIPNGPLYVSLSGSDVTNDCRVAGLPCATLRNALLQALPGDDINVATGVFTESSLEVTKSVVIQGQSPQLTVVQAAASLAAATDRVVSIASGITGTLKRMTIQYGRAPDGADDMSEGGNGIAGANGGGILSSGWLVIDDCRIATNRAGDGGQGDNSGGAGGQGGGIYSSGTLLVTNSVIIGNIAGEGGTGAFGGPGGAGGGVANDDVMAAVLSIFTNNVSGDGGAGSNTGGEAGDGGGVVNNGSIDVDRCEFASNRAGAGGAGSTGNEGGSGGGLFNGGSAIVIASTIAASTAGIGGAGDPGQQGAGGKGGGLYNEGDLSFLTCTLSGNRAGDAGAGAVSGGGGGGGLYNPAFAVVSNCTIASNSAGNPDGAGGGLNSSGGIALRLTLIGNNAAPGSGPDAFGDLESEGYNLLETTSGVTWSGDETGNVYGSNPNLAALAANGGPTRTHLLLSSSPAVDAGDPAFVAPPDYDQRGAPRVLSGRIDIGATEGALPAGDSDGDGLPDNWEVLYGLDPNDDGTTNAINGAQGDPDLDGYDNRLEFIAMTTPTDSNSFFRARNLQRSSGIAVSFLSFTGRLYTLQYADSLRIPSWSNVPGQVDVPGSVGTNALTDGAAPSSRHYRLGVRLP